MKAFFIVLLSLQLSSVAAFAQTVFNDDPEKDLIARYNASNATLQLSDFIGMKCSTFIKPNWQDESFVPHAVTWIEGARAGRGPLYPSRPGIEESKVGLVISDLSKSQKDRMVRNQKLADNGQSLICPDLGEYNYVDFRYDGQMIFYKADKYHVHRALGGPENANSFYGYCWKDK